VTRELLVDPYVLVTANRSDVHSLHDVAGHRLLGIRGCKNELLIEQHLLADGIVPSSCERFDDNALIQALAAAGEGIAVVPRLTVDPTDSRIAIQLVPELPPRQLTAITHSERRLPAAATQFIETASRVCAQQNNQPPLKRRAAYAVGSD
jgi:DNA-binding transcriptional LysR family regulator